MSEQLNPKQQEAAEFKEGIAAVIAVPGSGKTRTMMERIGILVTEYGIAPENILGLTFTRNASDEMRSRLVPVLGDLSSRVKLSTIHSFCHLLLGMEGRVFEILSGKEQMVFMKKVMQSLKVKDLTVGTVLREISLAKNNIIDAVEFKALFEGDGTMQKIADVYQAYDDKKRKKMLLDFDDLLLETYYLLRDNDQVRAKYQETFTSILVDEFQDTNPVQFEILRLLIREGIRPSSFWVAGDDHQAIYSFTGASVGNILNFQSMFPEAKQFILDLNYRSTPQILRACQNLIHHNVKQIHKELKTDNPDGDDIVVLEASNEETEAMGVVNEIVDLIERRGYQYSDIAVLYRANFQSRYVEDQHQVDRQQDQDRVLDQRRHPLGEVLRHPFRRQDASDHEAEKENQDDRTRRLGGGDDVARKDLQAQIAIDEEADEAGTERRDGCGLGRREHPTVNAPQNDDRQGQRGQCTHGGARLAYRVPLRRRFHPLLEQAPHA